MAGATIERFGMVTSLSLVQGHGSREKSFPRFGASNCLGSFCRHDFWKKLVYFKIFRSFCRLWIHTFLETIVTYSYHFDERVFHNSMVASHHPWRRAARFHRHLFSWHIWGWSHDAATDYAGVQLVTRQLCLEQDLAHWQCTKVLTMRPAAKSTVWCINHVIDWLVLGTTHCETILSNSCLKDLS